MKKPNRYDTSGLIEAQFEPGSRGRVLKNLLGITSKREMDRVEASEHLRALEELSGIYDIGHKFTSADVCKMHKVWLGRIYEWAGQYRQVNVSKGDFPFSASNQIPKLMTEFEKGPLRRFTPCRFSSQEEIARALAGCTYRVCFDSSFSRRQWKSRENTKRLNGIAGGVAASGFWGHQGEDEGGILRGNKGRIG